MRRANLKCIEGEEVGRERGRRRHFSFDALLQRLPAYRPVPGELRNAHRCPGLGVAAVFARLPLYQATFETVVLG